MTFAGSGDFSAVDHAAMQTLGEIARYHASRRPEGVALLFENRITTWAELDRLADAIARSLLGEGLQPGDRVGCIGKASDHFFALLFGVARARGVLVPIQWRLAPAEISELLADCEPRFVFCGSELPSLPGELRDCNAELPPARILDVAIDMWARAAGGDVLVEHADPTSVVMQLYTSGTTGRAKGVMLSHDNFLAGRRLGMAAGMDWNAWRVNEVCLTSMPIAHVGGVAWGLVALFNGVPLLIHPEFKPSRVLDAIEHAGVTKLFAVPTALRQLLDEPTVRDRDYSRLRCILYGASPVSEELLREAMAVFGCGLCQQYGMTETCGTVVYLPPEDHSLDNHRRMQAAGLPMPGVELRVVDPVTRNRMAVNELGEVETRSVANMVGYWRRPSETTEVLSSDGWLRTGDIGQIDEYGYLHIRDRLKDIICSGGENISPSEVERILADHPGIAELAIIGIPHEKWGEVAVAFVVLKPGESQDPENITEFARARIAAFKVPKSIVFVKELPRNASGKILRQKLRAPYWQGRQRRVN